MAMKHTVGGRRSGRTMAMVLSLPPGALVLAASGPEADYIGRMIMDVRGRDFPFKTISISSRYELETRLCGRAGPIVADHRLMEIMPMDDRITLERIMEQRNMTCDEFRFPRYMYGVDRAREADRGASGSVGSKEPDKGEEKVQRRAPRSHILLTKRALVHHRVQASGR